MTQVRLGFGGPRTPSGAIHLTDVLFDTSENTPAASLPVPAAPGAPVADPETPALAIAAPGPDGTVKRSTVSLTRVGRFSRRGAVRSSLSCAGELPCGLEVRLATGARVLTRRAVTLPAGRRVAMTLRLSAAQRRAVRRSAARRVTFSVIPIGATDGRAIRRNLRLR